MNLIERFLSKYRGGSIDAYKCALISLSRYTGINVKELIELGRQDKSRLEALLDEYRATLKRGGASDYTVNTYLAGIRAFFKFNGIDVRVRLERGTPKTLDYIPKPEEVDLLLQRAPLKLKVAICFMAYSGMRPVDVANLRFASIKDEIRLENNIYKALKIPLKIVVKQQKTSQWYITFLGKKGVDILLAYLNEVYEARNTPWQDDEKLLPYNDGESIYKAITRYIEKLKLKHPEAFKRFRPYSLRKYFRRQLAGANISDAEAEYLMGHVGGLNSLQAIYTGLRDLDTEAIEQLRQKYAQAIPRLEGSGSVVNKVELIKAFAKSLGIENIDVKIARLRRENRDVDELELIGKLIKEELFKNLASRSNGGRRYRATVVSEDKLVDYITEGWELVRELSNDRYLLRIEEA